MIENEEFTTLFEQTKDDHDRITGNTVNGYTIQDVFIITGMILHG